MFTPSSGFTLSPTESFTPSNKFTPSDSKYVELERQKKLAKLPPQTSPYGNISIQQMQTISFSVLGIILGVGIVLMVFYVRIKTRNAVSEDLSDRINISSESDDESSDENLAFSYTYTYTYASSSSDHKFDIYPQEFLDDQYPNKTIY